MSLIENLLKLPIGKFQRALFHLEKCGDVLTERIDVPLPLMKEFWYKCNVYMQGDETLFLLRDFSHLPCDVVADETFSNGKPPQYSSGKYQWTSPVYIVQLLCHAYKEVMRKTGKEPGKVHGMFFTGVRIVNKKDLEDLWKWFGVKVVDGTICMAKVGDNNPAKEKEKLDFFLDNIDLATWELDPRYDHVVENYSPTTPPDNGDGEQDSTNQKTPVEAFVELIDSLLLQDDENEDGHEEEEDEVIMRMREEWKIMRKTMRNSPPQ